MPQYRVIAKGYTNSMLYSPDHPTRNVLHTDKPFPKGKLPSWVEEMKDETDAQRKSRQTAETKKNSEDAIKQKEDKEAIESVRFTSGVETL